MSPSSGARNVELIFFKMILMHELIWDLHGAGLIYIIAISFLVCSFSSLLAPSCIINLQCQLLEAATCWSKRKLLMTSMCIDGFGLDVTYLDFLRFTWKNMESQKYFLTVMISNAQNFLLNSSFLMPNWCELQNLSVLMILLSPMFQDMQTAAQGDGSVAPITANFLLKTKDELCPS
ncbi:hypothetical protein MRB53_018968 [Persea americana]|uniref:Uncharacterized protein n=1 Tax=Persea americana TaxID=3435 RepID=A0ACC2M9H7_PERAE|nr:hypothetical protein MRB53_018968 [Persea americana]